MGAKSKTAVVFIFSLLTLFGCGGNGESEDTAVDETINVQPVFTFLAEKRPLFVESSP